MGRRIAAVFAVVVVAGLLTPLVTGRDSFPVSTYPMFSYPRADETTVSYAVSVDDAGDETRLRPAMVGGTAEVVHAAETIRQAVRRDDTDGLCGEIAGRVAADDPTAVAVEIRRDTYDVVGWFEGDETPLARTVLAGCGVGR